MGFNPKNHPKFLKRLIFIWEKATFFFEELFRLWPEHGESPKVTAFFWAQNFGFSPKNQIFAIFSPRHDG